MQKTSNYQLSQWDPEDRILREDFNSDNAKLDAALAAVDTKIAAEAAAREALARRTEYRLIQSVTTTADANAVKISMGGISWNSWRAVHILIDPYTSASGSVRFNLDGAASLSLGSMSGNVALNGPLHNRFYAVFYSFEDRKQIITGAVLGVTAPKLFTFGAAYNELSHLEMAVFDSSNLLLAGTTYKIWGETR